jgi:phage/plasmid-like protein (TIGR03299 family)
MLALFILEFYSLVVARNLAPICSLIGKSDMSHELTMNNGVAEMAYVGDTPWHGLGAKLMPDQSIEDWTKAAGMDWQIKRAVVRFATEHDQDAMQYGRMDDKHVLLRSDTKAPLGVVSDKYNIVQPKAVLEFFRDLTEDYGFDLETAGTLYGGARFWALAKIGEHAQVGKGDKIGGYLLLCTSADGTLATEARYTTVRVVCNNTLSFAREAGKPDVKVSHRTKFNADKAKDDLQVGVHSAFEATMNQYRMLADKRMLSDDVIRKTVELFKPNSSEMAKDEFIKAMNSKPVTRIMQLALDGQARGSELDGVQGTAWGWLNAVTEYVDHEGRARSQDNRLNSAWFGKGDELKTRALQLVSADGELLERTTPDLLDGVLKSWKR